MTESTDKLADITALLDQLVDAIEEAKHAEWSSPRGDLHDELESTFQFLVEQAHAISDAASASPSISAAGRFQRNIAADAGGDPTRLAALVAEDVQRLATLARAALGTPGADPALRAFLDGLPPHLTALEELAGRR